MIILVAGASLSYAIPANSVEFDLGAAAIGNQLTGCHFASGDSGVVCPNSQNFTINDPSIPGGSSMFTVTGYSNSPFTSASATALTNPAWRTSPTHPAATPPSPLESGVLVKTARRG